MVADRRGSGPAVVLLHGQPGTAWDWQWVAPLLEADFDVLIPDRPGYGRTGGAALGFVGNADAVVTLMDHLEVPEAILVGHSWAGGIVIAAAERHADRVTGVVLVSSVAPGVAAGWEDRLLAAPVIGELIAGVTIGGTGLLVGSQRVQRLADRRLAGRARAAFSAVSRLADEPGAMRVWRSFVTEQRALIEELDSLSGGLAHIGQPTSIINGESDRLVDPKVGLALSHAIPSSKRVLLPGVGHLLPHDRPEAIADAVRDVYTRSQTAG
jgi:pimeloyl-ACP methyl ester carboxylesterase